MSRDERAIRKLVAAWTKATAAGKAESPRPLLAEDVTFLTPGHPAIRGRDLFVEGLKHTFRQIRIKPSADIQEIQISGDMAYCWSYLTVAMKPKAGGAESACAGSALSVLRKLSSGKWVISRDANMLAAVDDD